MKRSILLTLLPAGVLAAAARPQTLLTTVRVGSGFSLPLWCGSPPGDHARLFVAEKNSGQIRILRNGALLTTPFVTVTGILTGGERGLLGVAFHPNYAVNGWFYVNYTRQGDGATMVVRFTALGDPRTSDVADPNSRTTVIGPIAQPFANHNGGNVAFGPDGYLYIGMGDGGSGGDPSCNAQNRLQLLGKMLRIDVNTQPYSIPPTNPFAGNAQYRPEIWALGLRNPWRFCFDRLTRDLYIGDVGQNAIEEIDFQPGNSTGGENYGWKIMEGTSCNSTLSCLTYAPACNSSALKLPIHQYPNPATGCSVTGGCVYRGCAIPVLQGTYFFADYCSDQIWSFVYAGGAVTQFQNRTAELAPGGVMSITSPVHFGEDARGEIHIVDHSGGEIFKIVARTATNPSVAFGGVASPTTIATPAIRLDGGSPVVGNTSLAIAGSGLVPGGASGVLLGLGNLDPGLPVAGAPATALIYVNPVFAANIVLADGSGNAALPLGIPCNVSLVGLPVTSQYVAFDTALPAAVPIGTSAGMRLVVGS